MRDHVARLICGKTGETDVGRRYAVLAARCTAVELDDIWNALLFGRGELAPHLEPIASALRALRDEVGRRSAQRSASNASQEFSL